MRRSGGLGFVLCFFFSLCFAQSQLGTGAISGSVTDPSGQAVADAAVTVTNTDTGLVRNVNTGMAGQFLAPVLPTGTYAVRVEKAGFSRLEQKNLVVNVGGTVTLQLQLTIGAVQAVVEVTAEAPLVDTTKTDESSLVTRDQILDLPINGRRADQFALLVPGVTRDGPYGLLSYRGIAGVFNNYTVEGNDDNQAYYGEPRGRTRIASSSSSNAVQEFQVGKSNFLAEFGRAAGGSINAVYRSGGNKFHADAFYYFRNQDMGARDPLTTLKPQEQRQQFGGSVSGPIRKDKLFFFVNWDQQVRNFPEVIQDTNGTLTTGKPDPNGSLYRNNAALYSADLNAFTTGVALLKKQFDTFAPAGLLPRQFNQQNPLAKVDWIINQRNTFSATYNYMRAHNPNGMYTSVVANNPSGANDDVRLHNVNVRLTSTLTPTHVNELRFHYSRDLEFAVSDVPGPSLYILSATFGRNFNVDRNAYPDERRVQVADNFSYIKGTHAFKFGGDVNRPQDRIDMTGNFQGEFVYSNALYLGRDLVPAAQRDPSWAANSYTNYLQNFGLRGITYAVVDYAAFAQDQWKALRRLTINYGVRYDYEALPKPMFPNPAIPETQKFPADRRNFGPRAGLAYDVRGNGKTVVRAGYGMLFARTGNAMIDNALRQTGLNDPTKNLMSFTILPSDPGAPRYPTNFSDAPSAVKTSASTTVTRLGSDFQRPRVQEINVGVERQLARTLSVTASYVYTHGDRMQMRYNTNIIAPNFTRTYQLPDGTTLTVPYSGGMSRTATGQSVSINLSRPNPSYGDIWVMRSMGGSWYNAMMLEVKRRFAQGFQMYISYTLAKAEDTAGYANGGGSGNQTAYSGYGPANQFDMAHARGIAATAQRHRLVASSIWNMPFKSGNGALNHLIHGYRLSGIWTAESGRPYASMVSVPNIPFLQPDGSQWVGQSGGLYGQGSSPVPSIPINSIHGRPLYRLDARFARDIQLKEGMKLEFLAEGFNVFNHANYNNFNYTMYTAVAPVGTPPPISTPIQLTRNANYGTPRDDTFPPDGTGARRLQLSVRFRF